MPAATIETKKRLWRTKKAKGKRGYLFNHKALAKVFRAKMLDAITGEGLTLPARYAPPKRVNSTAVLSLLWCRHEDRTNTHRPFALWSACGADRRSRRCIGDVSVFFNPWAGNRPVRAESRVRLDDPQNRRQIACFQPLLPQWQRETPVLATR